MGTSVKSQPQCIVVLKLPRYQVSLLITRARSIVQAMTQSSWFPSPRPPLATVAAAIEALAEAETATHGGNETHTSIRNRKELDLRILLRQLGDHVQTIADANIEHAAAIIESAGMYVKKARGGGRRGFHLRNGRVSGEIDAFVPQAGNRASYEWELSLDECVTWSASRGTTSARTTITNLPPGARVWVRHRSVVKNVTSDWSEPAGIIVT